MTMGFDQILALLSSDFVKAIALFEGLYYAGKITIPQAKKIKEKIEELHQKRVLGIDASKELGNELLKIDNTPKYLKLKALIGTHITLKVARVGLYLEKLNEEGRTLDVDRIRREVRENFGYDGMQLLNMASSGILSEVIDQLADIKETRNLDKDEMMEQYIYAIRKYEDTTIWVSNDDLKDNVELRILKKMHYMRPQSFFVVGSGNAAMTAARAIAALGNEENEIQKRGYMVFTPKIDPRGEERKQFLWTFFRFV